MCSLQYPKILSVLVICLLSVVGTCAASELQQDLLKHVRSGEVTERYTACLVLADLPLSPSLLSSIGAQIKTEHDRINRLCLRYVLARRTQEAKYDKAFIAAYPSGQDIDLLLQRQEDAGYPFGVAPPPERYLGELAYQSDDALRKLMTGLRYADGAHGEALLDLIANIYGRQPVRVEREAIVAGISIKEIKDNWEARRRHE